MKIKFLFAICLSSMLILAQCNPKKTDSSVQNEDKKTIAEVPTYKLEQVWATEALLKTPESVIHDEARDVLYVSNVNENPWEKDGNGFISKVSTKGKIIELEWVTGFSGPKGMAIMDNKLYVADLDEVGIIDVEKGEIIEKIKIEGASGLNDITPDLEGGIFISDSNGGKIFQIKDGNVSTFHNDSPGRPNGLFVHNGSLLVAFSETGEFLSYNLNTKEKSIIATEIGHGDGITPTNEADTYIVSDWSGEVFIISKKGQKQSLLNTKDQEKNTADTWFIKDKNLVLVPTFFDNRIVAYTLVKEDQRVY